MKKQVNKFTADKTDNQRLIDPDFIKRIVSETFKSIQEEIANMKPISQEEIEKTKERVPIKNYLL